jgi:PII-like signaling protein
MLKAGPAKKVTIYVGQDHQYHGEAVYAAILQFLFYHQVSGASVTRGIADLVPIIGCTPIAR